MTKKELAANNELLADFFGRVQDHHESTTDYLQLVMTKVAEEYEYSCVIARIIRPANYSYATVSVAQVIEPYNTFVSDKKTCSSIDASMMDALVQVITQINKEDETQQSVQGDEL